MAPTQLEIKVNALKRLLKEESLYAHEVEEQEKYVKQMEANQADEYELKKQIQVLDESKKMVPEVTKKITQHRESLKSFLETYNGDEDVSAAQQLLQ